MSHATRGLAQQMANVNLPSLSLTAHSCSTYLARVTQTQPVRVCIYRRVYVIALPTRAECRRSCSDGADGIHCPRWAHDFPHTHTHTHTLREIAQPTTPLIPHGYTSTDDPERWCYTRSLFFFLAHSLACSLRGNDMSRHGLSHNAPRRARGMYVDIVLPTCC